MQEVREEGLEGDEPYPVRLLKGMGRRRQHNGAKIENSYLGQLIGKMMMIKMIEARRRRRAKVGRIGRNGFQDWKQEWIWTWDVELDWEGKTLPVTARTERLEKMLGNELA